MPPAGADELLGSLIGQQAELASLRELLIKRTGGNPFFIEEIVRSLAETGALVGSRGAYTLGTAIDAVRVPSTVRTVLAERVDRLPMAEKQLLQTAAVIGVVVPLRLLQAVTGLPYEEIQRYLFDLQAAEFLFEINLFPDLEYSFKHALTVKWSTARCCTIAGPLSTRLSSGLSKSLPEITITSKLWLITLLKPSFGRRRFVTLGKPGPRRCLVRLSWNPWRIIGTR